ncbi:MAG: hypothetical protein JWQ23_3505 [Herminiimonas sp.]|jgi:hypothetical protein|nr:hypothetical protein [Herminiimonas sp.]
MKFAHLIEINDPLNPLIEPLSREQLWRGLVLRAEQPKMFVPWLDECSILSHSTASMERRLRYGDTVIEDRVTFLPRLHVHYHVPQQNDIPASDLNVTIEEPQPGLLFVRFEYDDNNNDEGTADAFYNEFRRSAYQESDIDTVRMIRQMAAAGTLDAPAA